MVKRSELPRFRTHKKAGRDGKVWVSYWYDMRGTGLPDVALGTDRELALDRWQKIKSGEVTFTRKRTRAAAKQPDRRQPTKPEKGKRRNFDSGVWAFAPAWAKTLYVAAERRSVAAARPRFLSPEEFLSVVQRAGGACELTGLPFDVDRSVPKARRPFAPSLDRIDCRLGYTAGNVRLVCTIINCALGDFGEEALAKAADAFLRDRSRKRLME